MYSIKFAIKYALIMVPIMILVAVLGHFLGDMLNDFLPDDGIDVYSSQEAAYAAAYRGERIMDYVERIVILITAIVVFIKMRKKDMKEKKEENQ